MGVDLVVDFPGELALLALGYTQPLQHFKSHLVTCSRACTIHLIGIPGQGFWRHQLNRRVAQQQTVGLLGGVYCVSARGHHGEV